MKRARGAYMPLNTGPGMEGLGLRAQIYKTCLDAIFDGRLAPGTRLPSARQLALDWKVARNTVDEAIAELQSAGFVIRRVGDGTFVARDVPRPRSGKIRAPSAIGRSALRTVSARGRRTSTAYSPASQPRPEAFVGGLPALDQFPVDLWRRLVARRLRSSGRALLGYVDPMGYLPLRESTARHLATTRGIVCSAEQVMIVYSSVQAVDLVVRVLLDPGDAAVVEDPGFPNLHVTLAMTGTRVIPVPVDAGGIDVARGVHAIRDAGLVYVTASCQYPTGVPLALERRLDLLRWAERTGAWIVEDDYQSEFTYEGRPIAAIHSLDRSERVLYLGTFSGSVFPSLRLAYLVLPKPLVAVFRAIRAQLDDHTHGLAQAVLADFIDGGHFSAHLRRMRSIYLARRDALRAACARELSGRARLGPTVSGMSAALHLPARISDRGFVARAHGAGLRLMPLSRYCAGAARLNGLLLGYAALSERQIAAGVVRLAALLPGAQ
jgi:GntR family transcriptional regulator/MocR family aminotransferase